MPVWNSVCYKHFLEFCILNQITNFDASRALMNVDKYRDDLLFILVILLFFSVYFVSFFSFFCVFLPFLNAYSYIYSIHFTFFMDLKRRERMDWLCDKNFECVRVFCYFEKKLCLFANFERRCIAFFGKGKKKVGSLFCCFDSFEMVSRACERKIILV